MTDVRALTVKQPWAWAIAHGGKTVENRSRGAAWRGTLLIHAGASWSARGDSDPRVLAAWQAAGLPTVEGRVSMWPKHAPLGVVVAVAELVDSHPDAGCCRPWGESEYAEGAGRLRTAVHHLVLEDVRPLPRPLQVRGALGLWRPPADLVDVALAEVGLAPKETVAE